MAYVNVTEWKAEQVSDWLRGLDDSIYPYAHFFLNNNVTGQGLLNLTVDDLYKLHVEKLGHQEIILESLEQLKSFHYSLDQENLQYVCLKLSCKARSLYNEIQMRFPVCVGKQVVSGAIMSAVGDVLDSVRLLLSWLERKPFDSKEEFFKVRTTLISVSLELATNTHREAFAEQPIDVIRSCCDKLGELSDQVIQEGRDPLLLQPASLDVATVRKKADEELGVVVEGVVPGVHLVSEVNMLNPSTRIQPGDEIVQVNYQTVVGWQTKKVVHVMGENPGEVILTLKKRPKHANLLGQVYMKPFRIPARKKSAFYFNNLPSPRTELLVVPDVSIPIKKRVPSESSADESHLSEDDSDSENDEAFLPVAAAEVAGQIERGKAAVSPTSSLRSVLSRPRSAPQRRATISGTLPRSKPYINVGETWEEYRDCSLLEISYSTISSRDSGVSTMSAKADFQLRPKAGAPQTPRPVTVAAPPMAMHQVTSAPNLRSEHMRPRHKKENSENMHFKNGSLNIEVKSQDKHPVSGDKIVLKVSHEPKHVDKTADMFDTATAVVEGRRVSVYMNVPTQHSDAQVEDPTAGVPCHAGGTADAAVHTEGKRVHEYVNVCTDLVNNTNPLPKPRTPKSSLTFVGGGDGSVSPASNTGSRGKRPVPLPRRFSTAEASPKQRPTGPAVTGGGGGSPTVRLVAAEGSVHSRSSPALNSPAPRTPAAKPGLAAPGRPAHQPGSVQKITPTASYKSYRRVAPDLPLVSKVAQEGAAPTRRQSSSDAHYTEIGQFAPVTAGSPDGARLAGHATAACRKVPELLGAKKSRSTATRLSFDSVSSCDSGLADSLSPSSPFCTPHPAFPPPGPPNSAFTSPPTPHSAFPLTTSSHNSAQVLPALPPRNHVSSSSSKPF